MVPADLLGFFTATVAAAGTLIGLLFVAISLRPHQVLGSAADTETRRIAESAFTALVNVFFVSLAGLIPDTNVGWTTAILGGIGMVISLRRRPSPDRGSWFVSLLSLGVYVAEVFLGVMAVVHPHDATWPDNVTGVLIAALAVALARAWTLLRGAGPV